MASRKVCQGARSGLDKAGAHGREPEGDPGGFKGVQAQPGGNNGHTQVKAKDKIATPVPRNESSGAPVPAADVACRSGTVCGVVCIAFKGPVISKAAAIDGDGPGAVAERPVAHEVGQ